MDITKQEMLEEWNRAAGHRYTLQRRANYAEGDHAILHKAGQRKDGKDFNKVLMNWVGLLVSRHVGFLTGQAWNVTTNDETAEAALDQYDDVRDANDLDEQG